MNKKWVSLSLILFLLLSACDELGAGIGELGYDRVTPIVENETPGEQAMDEPLSRPTSTPLSPPVQALTPTPEPSLTPEPLPTMEPSPTVEPPPSIPPSPTPPAAEDLLVRTLDRMAMVASFHFDWLIENIEIYQGNEYVPQKVTFIGDYQEPRKFMGTVNSLMADNVAVITIGNEVYTADSTSGAWDKSSWATLEELGLVLTPTMPEGEYSELTYVAEELIDDTAVHHITGWLQVEGAGKEDNQLDFWIGVEDDLTYQVRSEFAVDGEESRTRVTKQFSDHNKAVDIAAPAAPPLTTLQASPKLGLTYRLPEGWERIDWGEAGCAAANCRGERIDRVHADGSQTGLSIAVLDAAAEEALREKLQGYEESEINGRQSFWRVDDDQLEAVLLFDDESLHVRGTWKEHLADETAVRQILGSIVPFKRFEIPGWLSLKLPINWQMLRGTAPGYILFSNEDVDPATAVAADLQMSERHAAIWLIDEGGADMPAYEMLLERLESADETNIVITPAQAIEINGQPAATILFQPSQPGSDTFEQLTMVQGPDRTVAVIGIGHEAMSTDTQALLEGIMSSLHVSSKPAPPRLVDPGQLPDDSVSYQTTEYRVNYPADWKTNRGFGVGSFSPPEADTQAFDTYVEHVTIRTNFRGEPLVARDGDWTIEEILREAWMLEWQFRPDMQLVSEIAAAEYGDQESAAALVGTSAADGMPNEGLLAVVRRGDAFVTMLAELKDFEGHRQEIENMVGSLIILETANN